MIRYNSSQILSLNDTITNQYNQLLLAIPSRENITLLPRHNIKLRRSDGNEKQALETNEMILYENNILGIRLNLFKPDQHFLLPQMWFTFCHCQ